MSAGAVAVLVGMIGLGVAGAISEHRRTRAQAERERARAQAEEVAYTAWVAEHPHQAAEIAAWSLGPGYDPSPIYRVTSAAPWVRPGVGVPAQCTECGATEYLTLMWVECREDLARMVCTGCGATWIDPAWATDEAVAWARAQEAETEWVTGQDQVPPATHGLAERMRREAGNTSRPQED